jgi:hypothetical protein
VDHNQKEIHLDLHCHENHCLLLVVEKEDLLQERLACETVVELVDKMSYSMDFVQAGCAYFVRHETLHLFRTLVCRAMALTV